MAMALQPSEAARTSAKSGQIYRDLGHVLLKSKGRNIFGCGSAVGFGADQHNRVLYNDSFPGSRVRADLHITA